jgi:signal transduction histidine kinase
MTERRPVWQRLYVPAYLTAGAVVCGWLGVYFAFQSHWLGVALPLIASGLTIIALRRGDRLAGASRANLRNALEIADARNRELERLSQLAAVMLRDVTLPNLFQAVADAAADLLEAEGAAITLLVEEGRFLRVEATAGIFSPAQGELIPSHASLSGWVVQHDQPIASDDVTGDPRATRLSSVDASLRTGAIVPLRSASVVIGTLGVVNRRDGRRFDDHHLRLLRTLGDQAVMALDRAHTFEEIRRNERDLTAKNVELERATRLKSEFLANMSHELRTPLNAIIGFSDLMYRGVTGSLNAEQREFLGDILSSSRHLLGLINDVLDLAKVESGTLVVVPQPVELTRVIGEVRDILRALATGRSVELDLHLAADLGSVVVDPAKLKQILYNYVSNALKFTPDGGRVTIRAELVGDAFRVEVADTGIGIAKEDLRHLFVAFRQLDAGLTKRYPGTGLGLALSKRLAEAHGGTVGVHSERGVGSTFWVEMPRRAVTAPSREQRRSVG